MSLLSAALLGIIEGLTEFLPVSSTAHLMLASRGLGLPQTEALKSFEIAIQLGAILAVVVLYWRSFVRDRRTLLLVLTAFIPTAVIGFVAHEFVKDVLLESVPTVLWSLFLGGIALIAFEMVFRERESHVYDVREMTWMQAMLIGVVQSIAIIPGVSRAAATIVGGQLLGLRRKTIVDFSFLLAVPTMAAATGLDLVKSAGSFSGADVLALAVGFITAFIVALLAIRWFLRFIAGHSFVPFGVYRIAVAVGCWVWLL